MTPITRAKQNSVQVGTWQRCPSFMIVQAYFRFSDNDFEPMITLSRPIVIGRIKHDRLQIVIRKNIDPLPQVAELTCIVSMRTFPSDGHWIS